MKANPATVPDTRRPRSSITVAVVLFALWVLLSGRLDAFHLGSGAIGVAFIMWLNRALEPFNAPGAPGLRILRAIPYGFWLFWQMIIAAIYVARVIIRPTRKLNPRLIRFRSDQPSLVTGVIFANSITLTPGTITVDFDDNHYVVHALTERTAQGVLDGDMARRVARLSSDNPIDPPKLLGVETMESPP